MHRHLNRPAPVLAAGGDAVRLAASVERVRRAWLGLWDGRRVAGFDIGAVGTRLRDSGAGMALPLALARDPAALLDALSGLAQQGGAELLELATG
jgi:hypothetical protein